MVAQETIKSPLMTDASHKSTFFRQSGWMMIATVASGVFMALVHGFSKVLPKQEYSALFTLFQVLNWMSIPALGLQMVFAQQASAVVTVAQKHQLVTTARTVMKWTFCIWLIMAAVAFLGRDYFIAALKISNPIALWLTVFIALLMLWRPILLGLLQGRQNFLWMGWAAIFDGVGRFFIVWVIVGLLHGGAAGALAGALIGLIVSFSTAAWHNRDLRHEPSAPFEARAWLQRVVPLTLGCGAFQFLFSADAIVVQAYLGDNGQAAPYGFGGTLARAIVLFTGPLAAVMFPKLVQSAARSQKSNLMNLTLLGTGILGCMAALGLTVVSPLLIKYGSNPDYKTILPLMPLFAWSMVPLAMANVLLNNLMAHARFKIVPALVILAIGYWVALQYHHSSFKEVIQTLGIFSSIFLAICAVFTWFVKEKGKPAADEEGVPVEPLSI
jgi:O-antigen/teichoic acid export membrane protein